MAKSLYNIPVPQNIKAMKISELRKYIKSEVDKLLDKVIVNKDIGISVLFKSISSRKTAYGEAAYYKKAAVIKHLPYIIENAVYNNFGSRKETDNPNIIGYLNFKFKCLIDNKPECLRIAIRFEKWEKFYYSIEVNKKS